ncbi:hybrid sensor histidine kinase/response regulator transcription factor [Dyadobacter arcticus]|uniref:histidine kinase n=1 Tax=Dyadobacter arcticus TaxID=1078754 RepID=A0ABX0UR69_9BACT|nr:hybrid sensor histidine kinase/response regulator transcription factor [Dyadobacter arcticus]NIJ55493.1 signal transduction histidine kinase/ligand-binding sensor domain-containing protein/DNA-binding response OmpR family regulator [Dyadobacter arcticus]
MNRAGRISRTWGIIFFLIMACLHARGQEKFFNSLSIREGLPTNLINAVAQDRNNFIWIATSDGLARYDGYHFRIFKKGETVGSIPSNGVQAIYADGDDLWIGTGKGLCKINTITFKITRTVTGTNTNIRCISKDRNGQLWLGTITGLLKYNLKNGTFKTYTKQNSQLSHNTVRTMFQDKKGTLWVGTYDGLNKLNPQTETFTVFDLKRKGTSALKNNLICDIKPVAEIDSLIWVGTDTGLCRFNIITGTNENQSDQIKLSNDVVKAIYTDKDRNVWLGTDFGLNVYDPLSGKNERYFHNPQSPYSIANNVIWQIFEDQAGVLWFVTSNGISKINQLDNLYQYHRVTQQLGEQTIGNQVKSFLVSKTGVYWIGTLHGVIRYDPKTLQSRKFDIDSPEKSRLLINNVTILHEGRDGRIWIGTVAGINVWDDEKEVMQAVTANKTNGLASNYINNFVETPDGSLLVGTWEGGIFRVNGDLNPLENLRFQLISKIETEKFFYGAGSLWLIEFDELFKLDLKTFEKRKVTSFARVADRKTVNSLFLAKSGIIWAATQNGLVEYNPKTEKAFFHAIPNYNIARTTITEDRNGNIWTATNAALEKFTATEKRVEFYPLNKNLPLKSFYAGCVARSASGELFFGGDNGYISFSPEKAIANGYQPKIFLTNLLLNNQPVEIGEKINDRVILDRDISFAQAIELDYGQRSIELQFAALHFWQPEVNNYSYKLERADENWTTTSGEKNFAVYSNLSPGTYIFKVKGTNNNGIWSHETSTTKITINPPFFLSKGFLALYLLLIAAGVYFGLKVYSGRIKLENELKISKLEIAHAEEIEQTKEQFFTNISHELRTPISLILPPIHQIMRDGKLNADNFKLISLAEKNSHRLLRVVNQILDFKKMQSDTLYLNITKVEIVSLLHELYSHFADKAARHEIDYTFTSNTPEFEIFADVEKVETMVLNLLSNAFKFTPKGGTIQLSIEIVTAANVSDEVVQICISDTGTGISTDDQARIFERFYQTTESRKREMGSGIGLALTLEYVKMHQGEITLDSEPGKGSIFTVLLPKGNADKLLAQVSEMDTYPVFNAALANSNKTETLLPGSEKPLLLIVEDNPDMVDFIRISLNEKYRFVIAGDGEEGLRKASEFLPDVIISDIMMPVMDGLTFCKSIKSNPKTSQLSVILLTARSLTSQKIEGIRVGADAYITKPFDIELLYAQIGNLLHRKKELTTYFRHELIVTPAPEDGKENMDDKFVKKVMSVIEAHISDPDFTVEILGSEIGMSSAHLSRKLKSLTQFSANEIIKKYRIKKASLLLENREGNISEVMYDVGFSNLSYFSKCFREEFGVTPKEYVKKEGRKFNIDISAR